MKRGHDVESAPGIFRFAGDEACEGGIVGDDGEDGPQGCVWACAELLRMGWFQHVHVKSMGSQEIRALLVTRKQLLGRLLDVELSIRGILRGFGPGDPQNV